MKLAMGLIFVLVGILLIFGIFTGDTLLNAFVNLINYWPIILVFIGLSILSGVKGLKWLKYLNAILTVCFILFIFFWPSAFLSGSRTVSETTLLETTEELTVVEIQIDLPMVNIRIEAMEAAAPLSTVAHVDHTIRGANLKIEESGSAILKKWTLKTDSNLSWLTSSTMVLKLNPAYKYIIKLNTAAVNGSFDIAGLKVEELDVNCAVLKADFRVPAVSNSRIEVKTAISNGDIFVPENVRAFLRARAAIKNVKSDLTKTGSGEEYIYEGAGNEYNTNLSFESAILNLKVLR
jgi:hypothetical protein